MDWTEGTQIDVHSVIEPFLVSELTLMTKVTVATSDEGKNEEDRTAVTGDMQGCCVWGEGGC